VVTRASTVPVPAGGVGAHELAEHDADHRQLSGSRGDRSARIRSSPESVRARLTAATMPLSASCRAETLTEISSWDPSGAGQPAASVHAVRRTWWS